MYDENAPKLAGLGYFPIPVAPANATYVAKKSPVVFNVWENRYVNLAEWSTMAAPVTAPQPGANIGVRCGNGIVALDYDDTDAALIISEAFPGTPVNKEGQRGWTAFYRADFDVPSQNFYDANGKRVLEVLSAGRQTVIPPSVHPDTKQPYKWTNGRSLYDTSPAELPPLPRDYIERISALGYAPQKSRPGVDEKLDPETGEIQNGFDDNPCAEVNAAALKNLSAWVPDLGLYNLKRNPGRGASYRAVADWRESSTSRPLEERERNLSIHPKGIEDFGDGAKYSPLDLVMKKRGTDLAESFCWLEEKCLPRKSDIEVDWDKLAETQDAPKTAPEDDDGVDPDADMTEAEEAMLGPAWEFGDPIPQEEPMLVPVFIPARPLLGFFGGQRSTFKTFVTNDLTVAVASGGEFAGQKVSYPGLVVQIELEGSLSRVRVTAAANHRGITEKLPIWQFTRTPPPILVNKRLNPEWKKWVDVFVRVAKRKAAKLGLPLALITMDPAMYFAGVDDNNSWSQ
jgi:hypothetical protein